MNKQNNLRDNSCTIRRRTDAQFGRLYTIAIAAILLLCLLSPFTASAQIVINSQSDWDALIVAPSVIPNTGGVIRLNANVTGNITIPNSVTELTIDGGTGHSLDGTVSKPAGAIALTLKDLAIRPTADGKPALHLAAGGTLTAQGTVALTGSDNPAGAAGSALTANANLTIAASDHTTFTGGNGAPGGSGVYMQSGNLIVTTGKPQFIGGEDIPGGGDDFDNGGGYNGW